VKKYLRIRSENASSRKFMGRLRRRMITMIAVIAVVTVKTIITAVTVTNLSFPRTTQEVMKITALVVMLIIFAKMDTTYESSCRS